MEDRRRKQAGHLAGQPEPFWTRLRAIALYPVHGAALWSMIALSLCALLGLLPGIGWFLGIIVSLATYRYAFEVLRHTANGHLDAPDYGMGLGDGAIGRLLLLTILAIAGVILVALFTRSGALTLLALGAVVLLAPASTISLAMDGSLRRALNPAVPLALATRIGWPYLAAVCLLFVILASALTAAAWLGRFMPPLVSHLTVNFMVTWGLFSIFHLLGYLVYQYHEVLGFEPDALADLRRPDPDQRLLDEAEAHVRDGHPKEAREVLRGAIRGRAVSLAVHELYHRLLRKDGASPELREHGQQFISRLIAEKQDRRALAVLRETLEQDPDFVPAQVEHAILLAERARLGGQYQLACDALQAMLRTWPKRSESLQWSLDAALLLAERYSRDDEARALLGDALARCEDDEQRRRLEAALNALGPQAAPVSTR
ncbi:MAG TPA: hypothetical protein VM687_05375 [Stenotrophomonas sp.]|nr:hypothetical protein [Stenotrophomonas sp.]